MNQLQTTSDLPKGWRENLERYYQQERLLDDDLKPLRNLLGNKLNEYWNADEAAQIDLLSRDAEISCCLILAGYFKGDPALVDAAYRQFGLYDPDSWDEIRPGHDKTWGQQVVEMVTSAYSLEREYFPESAKEIGYLSSDGWDRPTPLNDHSDLPIFPINEIQGICGDFARSLTKHAQVDPGLVGTMLLSTQSASLAGKVHVNLGTHEEPVNLYAIACLESGNRKSPVVKELSEPINLHQKEEQDLIHDLIPGAKSNHAIFQRRLEGLQKVAAKSDDPLERASIMVQCRSVIDEMNANPIPKKPVFLVDDITTEALGQIMADNNETVAVLSAEGGLFKNIAGLYNNGVSNIDLFLKAHAGDYWQSNRIGREANSMTHPALTLGLSVQPNVIEEICKNTEFRERGLQARFLFAWCRSRAGFRSRHSDPIPPHIKASYNEKILSLMRMKAHFKLTLTPEAQKLWDAFYDYIEKELRPGGELEKLVDWGSKLPGALARISGLLHFANLPISTDFTDEFQVNDKIDIDTVWVAISICEYYIEHAKVVYNTMKEDSTVIVAQKILDYIIRCKPVEFKGKDLFDHTNIGSMKEIQEGLNILIKNNYIRLKHHIVDNKVKGRPQSSSYEINPRIFLPYG